MSRRRTSTNNHRKTYNSKRGTGSSRSRSGRISGKGRRNHNSVNPAVVIVAVIVISFAVFFVRNLFFYITGNDITDENRYPVKGVDVSSYQLDIDWKGLENEGFKFAFIKATEGSSHVDERFEYNWEEAGKTDMKIGAYHFLSYDTDGKSQANNFIETVNKKWGMLPPIIDVELYGKYIESPPDKNRVIKILDKVIEELEDYYGKKPIIYTNTHIYQEYIAGEYDEHIIWISAHDIPEKLDDGREWTFCQYTFHGVSENVAGGKKHVDMNVFNGNSWEFRKYDWD